MKRWMILITALLGLLFLAAGAAWAFSHAAFLLTVCISLGTCFYHFAMRLAVGFALNACLKNQVDWTKAWFRERRFERAFYRRLRVRKWKKWVPTFDPGRFSLEAQPVQAILQAGCQAELVHELIMLLSFLPVLAAPWLGALPVFLGTSCAAFLVDSVFVVLQRYNRPRLLRLMERQA